jgi:hypothetical protein
VRDLKIDDIQSTRAKTQELFAVRSEGEKSRMSVGPTKSVKLFVGESEKHFGVFEVSALPSSVSPLDRWVATITHHLLRRSSKNLGSGS